MPLQLATPHDAQGGECRSGRQRLKIPARDRKTQIDNGSRKTVTALWSESPQTTDPASAKKTAEAPELGRRQFGSHDREEASPRKHRTPRQLWDQPLSRKPEVAGWRSALHHKRTKSRPRVRVLHPTNPYCTANDLAFTRGR